MKGMQGSMVLGFIIRDLVTVRIRYGEGKEQKDLLICCAYFPSDSVEVPLPTEFEKLVKFCSEKKPATPHLEWPKFSP